MVKLLGKSGKMKDFIHKNHLQIFTGKRILITGNTGFKGSWLSIMLLELGAEVFGYALEAPRAEDNFNRCKLARAYKHKNGDIRYAEKFKKYVNECRPEFVFHLAAQALVLPSYENPADTFATNVVGTAHVMDAVRQCESVKVFINVTSDKCYDNKEWVWGYRENDPMGGKDPYSASKACAELLFASYQHSFFNNSSTRLASVRAGNVIGAGDWSEYRIVPDFFRAYQAKKTLIIRNPQATRPWQHVLEPLTGYLHLAARLYQQKDNAFDGGWNFGPKTNTHQSVATLLDELRIEPSLKKVKIKHQPSKLHESEYLKLDISKATSKLGWQPLLDFEETIDLTRDGYLEELHLNGNLYDLRVAQIHRYASYCNPVNL